MLDALPRAGKECQLRLILHNETGARDDEVAKIYPHQLHGNNVLDYKSKGGKPISKELTPTTAEKLRTEFREKGKFYLSDSTFRAGLRSAAKMTRQKYKAIHGIRHSVACNLYRYEILSGASHYDALLTVSRFLGNERMDITLTYLRTGKD
jgi:integrase